jgi:hypothetical protein
MEGENRVLGKGRGERILVASVERLHVFLDYLKGNLGIRHE